MGLGWDWDGKGKGVVGWGRGYGGSRTTRMMVRDVGTLCFLMEWNERRWGGHGRCYLYSILPFFCGLTDTTLPYVLGFLYASHQILTSLLLLLLLHGAAWAT